jgi:hypothetical protein
VKFKAARALKTGLTSSQKTPQRYSRMLMRKVSRMGIFFLAYDISPYPAILSRSPHLHLLARFTRFVTYLPSGIEVALSELN